MEIHGLRTEYRALSDPNGQIMVWNSGRVATAGKFLIGKVSLPY